MKPLGSFLVAVLCWTVMAAPTRAVDGDTFDADVRVWLGFAKRSLIVQERIRVLDVNTPERGKPGFDEATAFAATWLLKGDVTLRTCERDFNGRILATVTRDAENLADLLVNAGLGARK